MTHLREPLQDAISLEHMLLSNIDEQIAGVLSCVQVVGAVQYDEIGPVVLEKQSGLVPLLESSCEADSVGFSVLGPESCAFKWLLLFGPLVMNGRISPGNRGSVLAGGYAEGGFDGVVSPEVSEVTLAVELIRGRGEFYASVYWR